MRFCLHQREKVWKWPVISLAVFLAVMIVFAVALGDLSQQTRQRQRLALETVSYIYRDQYGPALNRSIVACYALEGRYPEDLEYLQEHYSFTYDSRRFFVDYQLLADNLMPEVTILERGE